MSPDAAKVRVWYLPTRLFHWTPAACVIGSVVCARIGGSAMDWPVRSGHDVFTLLASRLRWGGVGGRWSRFSSFPNAPATLWRCLRGASRDGEHHEVGHGPLGALSVFALPLLAWCGAGVAALVALGG